jgi:hypothetical protein
MKFTLQNFESWLGRELKLSPSTRRNYRNFARAFLRNADHAAGLVSDPDRFVALAAEYDDSLASSSRGSFRLAIRAFARYLKAHQGVEVTFRFTRQCQREGSYSHSRHALGALLRDLQSHRVPFSRLEFIRWREVKRNGSKGELTDEMYGEYYLAPIETIKALNLWAGGGERASQDQPVVPASPKSFAPMSTRRMLRLARGP